MKGRVLAAIFASSLLGGIAFGLSTAPALAGTADSGVGYYTVGGHQYQNQATIYTTTGSALAYSESGTVSDTVPAGYIGNRGRLFTSGGSLWCEGSDTYSSESSGGGEWWDGISCSTGASGAWYSYGVTMAFNGGGYNSYYTYQSPNQNS